MKLYLRHLFSTLKNAANHAPAVLPEADARGEPPYVHLDELLGVPAELFPPATRLNPREAARLVRALRRLWAAYRIYPDLPETLPVERQYALLVAQMGGAEVAYYGAAGTWVAFCGYEPEDCVFGKAYCGCRALVEESAEPYNADYPFAYR